MTYSRNHPFLAALKERVLLSSHSSTKKTYHVVLHANGLQGHYKVGDSIGVIPENDPFEVAQILKLVGSDQVLDPRSQTQMSMEMFLTYKANLAKVNRAFVTQLVSAG